MIMNYQLPTGKVVYLSIEEFLDLTDEDIQYLIAHDCGDHIVNPFSGSALKSRKTTVNIHFFPPLWGMNP